MLEREQARRSFAALMNQHKRFVEAQKSRDAERTLHHMFRFLKSVPADMRPGMKDELRVQQRRVAELRAAVGKQRKTKSKQSRAPATKKSVAGKKQRTKSPLPSARPADQSTTVKCSLCGEAFVSHERKRTACYVCRPTSSRSVKTVSGGLPGLGKRH